MGYEFSTPAKAVRDRRAIEKRYYVCNTWDEVNSRNRLLSEIDEETVKHYKDNQHA